VSADFAFDQERWRELEREWKRSEWQPQVQLEWQPGVQLDWQPKVHLELQPGVQDRQRRLQRELEERQEWLLETQRERQVDLEHRWQERAHELAMRAEHALADRRSLAAAPPLLEQLIDQADSLYNSARELLNRGEYRRAAALFNDLAVKHPNSTHASNALYWHAFSLYRIGGTAELRTALESLNGQQSKYPNARTQADGQTLKTRILGALAARGDASAAAQIRGAAADSAQRCDQEEQAVRAEALNALTQSDPDGAMPLLQRILARKDECSARLRRSAIYLIGSKRRDAPGIALLVSAAKSDPSPDVRGSALEWLARVPGDEALATIEELTRDASDERIQRTAVRALVIHPSARAHQMVRSLVERNDAPERLRLEALGAFDKERSSAEDVAWMRTYYSRTDNPRIKSRLVSALTRIGGPEVDQWLVTVARNQDEDSETRAYALRRVAQTQPIADLARLYDGAAERSVRESLIDALGNRAEAEATDKLIEIVKTGTDPQLRSRAISALTSRSKKDPRTLRLLMELIDK
jgi:HEAT repeat protein